MLALLFSSGSKVQAIGSTQGSTTFPGSTSATATDAAPSTTQGSTTGPATSEQVTTPEATTGDTGGKLPAATTTTTFTDATPVTAEQKLEDTTTVAVEERNPGAQAASGGKGGKGGKEPKMAKLGEPGKGKGGKGKGGKGKGGKGKGGNVVSAPSSVNNNVGVGGDTGGTLTITVLGKETDESSGSGSDDAESKQGFALEADIAPAKAKKGKKEPKQPKQPKTAEMRQASRKADGPTSASWPRSSVAILAVVGAVLGAMMHAGKREAVGVGRAQYNSIGDSVHLVQVDPANPKTGLLE